MHLEAIEALEQEGKAGLSGEVYRQATGTPTSQPPPSCHGHVLAPGATCNSHSPPYEQARSACTNPKPGRSRAAWSMVDSLSDPPKTVSLWAVTCKTGSQTRRAAAGALLRMGRSAEAVGLLMRWAAAADAAGLHSSQAKAYLSAVVVWLAASDVMQADAVHQARARLASSEGLAK